MPLELHIRSDTSAYNDAESASCLEMSQPTSPMPVSEDLQEETSLLEDLSWPGHIAREISQRCRLSGVWQARRTNHESV